MAKSRGIAEEIASAPRCHFRPLEIKPDDFEESDSLVELAGGKLAYCHARNIGAGYDGRRDTVCSHVVVLDKEDFARCGCDTRGFAGLHPGDRQMRGILPPP